MTAVTHGLNSATRLTMLLLSVTGAARRVTRVCKKKLAGTAWNSSSLADGKQQQVRA